MALLLAGAALRCASAPAARPVALGSAPKPDGGRATARPSVAPADPAARTVAQPACAAVRVELPELITSSIDVDLPAIVDPNGAMKRFHERTARLLRKTAKDHVRIGVFGDSNMTMDWITGEMRRTLQAKYGDAGHGYVALGRPWNWYRHMDVRAGHLDLDWKAFAVSTRPSRDNAYGFAGIAVKSQHPGAITWVATADAAAPIGTRASRFDVYFLEKPGAGTFDVWVDGTRMASVSTDSPEFEAGFFEVTVSDGPHKLELQATSKKSVTLFGATLERDEPSFVVDSLGVGAVSGPLLLRQNAGVMRAALRHRNYDLIVLLLGSNQVWPVMYEKWMGELIGRFREALPDVAVLVMTPVDQVASPTATHSVPELALVARQNRQIARETGSAFWDFRGAMGGEASMVRFIAAGMGVTDGIHLTQKGARYMGRRLLRAILTETDRYLAEHPDAGCSSDPDPGRHAR